MKTVVTLSLSLLASSSAFAYDAATCAAYVKEKSYPAAYCLTVKGGEERGDETAWTDALRSLPGPIRALEKQALKEEGCEREDGCGILNLTDRDGVALRWDHMSGGTTRYFVTFDHNNHTQRVVYTIDVFQAYDEESDSFLRKVTKIEKLEP